MKRIVRCDLHAARANGRSNSFATGAVCPSQGGRVSLSQFDATADARNMFLGVPSI
jgi:hypothetical protein